MSWIDSKLEINKKGRIEKIANPISLYQPTDTAKERVSMIRSDFTQGYVSQQKPRREFNDMSMIVRTSLDQMAWSVYQPNDGDALEGDLTNSWRSNAVRPIVRNKVFSIAAHVTAHTLFPKIVAFDNDSTEQADAAQVMSDLLEWSTFNTNASYADVSLKAVISALVNPVSIVQTQYVETYRTVKTSKNDDGSWKTEQMLDEDLSGFIDESVPPDQIFIQDFYQPDIQKQGWVIRRRVRPFTILKALYQEYENFQYVKPGVIVIYNDSNQTFYDSYDQEMQQDECEEVLYWNKSLDLYLIAINGVLLNDENTPNPREDKLYPFASFGYEFLRANGDCFYWKSLAFKTMPDDKIVNTLYPMIIDGTFLAIMPPMVNIGGEIITSDVIVPGGVTTFSSPDADLKPLAVQNENLKAGMDALFKVEQNISEDAFQPLQQGDIPEGGGNMPAYNMSQMEKNAKLMLGPFLDMVGRYVKQMGRLRIGDIKQNLTLPDVAAIEGSANSDLVYKTFLLPQGKARGKAHKVKFTIDMPEDITEGQHLTESFKVLKEEGGMDSKYKLSKVNPVLFRNLKYLCFVGTDVLQPLSEELESSYNLQTYDRMVAAPPGMFDPEETAKLLLETSPTTKKHPDKFLGTGQPAQPTMQAQMTAGKQQSPLSPPMQQQPMPMGK